MPRLTPHAIRARLAFSALLAALAALPLRAQAPGAGTISGSVRDAESAAPVAGASVSLDPGSHSALSAAGASLLRAARTTHADERGEYRFDGVAPGGYRLHLQQSGYRAASVDVTLRPPAESRSPTGVQMAPVMLQPVARRPRASGRARALRIVALLLKLPTSSPTTR